MGDKTFMMNTLRLAVVLILPQVHPSMVAATLKPETKAAWEEYLQAANAAMQARLQPNAHFLWIDEEPGRPEQIRTNRLYIATMGPHIPKKVPFGLVHDWLGAGFIPNVKIDDVLRIVRDYDHYKEIYKPGVIGSTSRSTDGVKDVFSMRLANKSVVSKTALDAECEASYFSGGRPLLVLRFEHNLHHEVDKFGTPEENLFPEDQGTGLIWRLSSITRLEERDGGYMRRWKPSR
jgi:hypothetical protein